MVNKLCSCLRFETNRAKWTVYDNIGAELGKNKALLAKSSLRIWRYYCFLSENWGLKEFGKQKKKRKGVAFSREGSKHQTYKQSELINRKTETFYVNFWIPEQKKRGRVAYSEHAGRGAPFRHLSPLKKHVFAWAFFSYLLSANREMQSEA